MHEVMHVERLVCGSSCDVCGGERYKVERSRDQKSPRKHGARGKCIGGYVQVWETPLHYIDRTSSVNPLRFGFRRIPNHNVIEGSAAMYAGRVQPKGAHAHA